MFPQGLRRSRCQGQRKGEHYIPESLGAQSHSSKTTAVSATNRVSSIPCKVSQGQGLSQHMHRKWQLSSKAVFKRNRIRVCLITFPNSECLVSVCTLRLNHKMYFKWFRKKNITFCLIDGKVSTNFCSSL